MALHNNLHRKPRRMKGTPMFIYRHYITGGVFAISGLFYLVFHFSPASKRLCDMLGEPNEINFERSNYAELTILGRSDVNALRREFAASQRHKDLME